MVTSEEWERVEKSTGYTVYDFERTQFENGDLVPTPQFAIGDWRQFVPDYVRERWHELDTVGKLCAFVSAKAAGERNANDSRWDE